jgi:hypothetical protein
VENEFTENEYRAALRFVSNPSAYKLTEVELRACKAVIEERAKPRSITLDDALIAKALFIKMLPWRTC